MAEKVDNPVSLFGVFVVIAGLAVATLALSTATFSPSMKLILQMAIASVQAFLVGWTFMHLKHADKVTILCALSALFWTGILFVLFLSDYSTRKLGSL